jgi:hypothetical protein
MDRRMFLATVAGSLLAAPLAAEGQSARTVPRIGVIVEQTSTDPFLAAFRQALRDLGYTEGQNIVIEYRYAHGGSPGFLNSSPNSSVLESMSWSLVGRQPRNRPRL